MVSFLCGLTFLGLDGEREKERIVTLRERSTTDKMGTFSKHARDEDKVMSSKMKAGATGVRERDGESG